MIIPIISHLIHLQVYHPFTDYFDLEPVDEYHDRVITLDEFLKTHADMKWPTGERKAYCSKDAAKMNMNGDRCPRVGIKKH